MWRIKPWIPWILEKCTMIKVFWNLSTVCWCFTATSVHFSWKLQWTVCIGMFFGVLIKCRKHVFLTSLGLSVCESMSQFCVLVSPISQVSALLSTSFLPMMNQMQAIQWANSANMDMSRVSTTVLCWEYRSIFCSRRSSLSRRTVFSRCTTDTWQREKGKHINSVCKCIWGLWRARSCQVKRVQ